ncbi:hypothetical protein [Sporomusa acidovorans]|uniref:Uncharacterized protein n=1 Tax=Sporomusa acidovorans (strain ATCC 49682 / DSM 3132 / Mol) TaxID=1123286 RepID=A0ABZ3IWY3_SPOA4|nr:hypothetical protein [Sporomusa acidovorans]OZC23342.1 hypothetical protein SPACI_07540 [Sporomusa acidovorans DSM 3132]SDE42405.1 hypothetical protein SAMN04488499_101356 [Sporomusa acidovorans]
MKTVNEELKNKLIDLAKNGKLTCAEAHQLAESAGVSLRVIGKAVEAAGIKISDCQLGCFGKYKER